MLAAVRSCWRAVCLLMRRFLVLNVVGLARPTGPMWKDDGVVVELCRPNSWELGPCKQAAQGSVACVILACSQGNAA